MRHSYRTSIVVEHIWCAIWRSAYTSHTIFDAAAHGALLRTFRMLSRSRVGMCANCGCRVVRAETNDATG